MIHPATRVTPIGDDVGLGLVATEVIPLGTIVWAHDALTQVVPSETFDALHPLVRDVASVRVAYRRVQGDYVVLWDDARFMNHSCEPNCGVTAAGFEIAVRTIESGEQLTNDYAMLHIDEDEPFLCACGAARCRTIIRHDDATGLRRGWNRQIAEALTLAADLDQPLAALLTPGQLRHAFRQAVEPTGTFPRPARGSASTGDRALPQRFSALDVAEPVSLTT